MPSKRTHLAVGLTVGTATFVLPVAPVAQAGLLGGLTTTIGQLVNTAGSTVPVGLGSTVEGVTGTAGGLVTGLGGTVDDTLQTVTGGAQFEPGLLDGLLATVLGTTNGAVNTGTGAAGGSTGGLIGGPGGTIGGGNVVDARPPHVTYTVLSKLRGVQGTGRFKLRVKSDEPGIVILSGKLTPGKELKRSRARSSAAAVKIPAVVLGYRKAGSLNVKFQLSKAARKRLGSVKNAKLTLETVAADAYRNQERDRVKRTVKR